MAVTSVVPIAIAGGIALSYWGNPRSTQDIDIAMLAETTEPIEANLRQAGFKQVEGTNKNLGLFTLKQWLFEPVDHFVAVEIDLLIASSKYYHTALDRALTVDLEGLPTSVSVLSREDLIIHKLYASWLIDQADVHNLLENHWNDLDRNYLEEWTETLSLNSE